VSGTYTLPNTNTQDSTITSLEVNGTLIANYTVRVGYAGSGQLRVNSGGKIVGTDYLIIEDNVSVPSVQGTISPALVYFYGPSVSKITPFTVGAPVEFRSLVDQSSFTFNSGTFQFLNDVTFLPFGGGNTIINNSANNPNFVFGGNVVANVSQGNLTWRKGSGQISFSSNAAQSADLKGLSVENIISSNTSSGGLTFVSSFTTAQLSVNTAVLSSAATIYFAGNSTFTISTFTVNGTSSFPVTLKSTDTTKQWFLNNTSSNSVSYVQVSSSNANPGITLAAGFAIGIAFTLLVAYSTAPALVERGVRKRGASLLASVGIPLPVAEPLASMVAPLARDATRDALRP
jgi:hypothetical protein